MRLQLRVRHALGARMVEIEPRGPERPIVIGRTAEADVQVPIGTVAPAHCVMYIEQDQWVVQDNGSSGGTYVNGQAISGPVFVDFGDVVSLGASESAPTIEIDPMGTRRARAGRGGGAQGRPALPKEQEPQAFYEEKVSAAPAAASEETSEGDELVEMPGATVGYRRRRPVRKQGSYVGITIVAAVGIILAGWWIVSQMMKEDEPQKEAQSAPQDVRGGNGGKNIFEFPQTQKAGAKVQNDPVLIPPVALASEEEKPAKAVDNDPERQSDEWKAVVDANYPSEKPGKALWTIVDYRRLHPGKFESELKQYEDAAFDRLWWERIRDLCELRDSLGMEIQKKNVEIAQETEAAYKEKLVKEKETLALRRQNATDTLAEMGYAAKDPPNLFDAVQLANLRAKRVPETYEAWKKRVTSSLMRTRGLPWER